MTEEVFTVEQIADLDAEIHDILHSQMGPTNSIRSGLIREKLEMQFALMKEADVQVHGKHYKAFRDRVLALMNAHETN